MKIKKERFRMKKQNEKIVIGLVVITVVIGALTLLIHNTQSKTDSLRKKEITNLTKKIATTKKQTIKMESKEIDVDGMKMRVSGTLTQKELEQIKSQIPKELLKGNSTVSVKVINQEGTLKNLTPQQRKAMTKAVKEQLKKAFEKMPEKDRKKMRKNLNSPEGEKAMRNSVMNYNKQLTGEERTAADPAFQAVLSTLNEMKKEKK